MHIVIYGVGAVGGTYGTWLTESQKKTGIKISFLARTKTYEAIKKNGIKLFAVEELDKEQIIEERVDVYENFSDIKNVDIVLLCVKSKDTRSAAEDIAKSLSSDAYVVSVQNGVENEEILSEILGKERVMGCLTNIASQNREPGVYYQAGLYNIIFGELDGSETDRVKELHKLFLDSGINALISKDIYTEMWTKLVWNAGFNTLTALHEMTVGELLDDPDLKDLILFVMKETTAVARAQGIMVPEDSPEKQLARTAVPEWRDFKTSMFQDILRKRPIEIEELLGVVIRKGKEFNIPTPYAESVYGALKKKLEKMALV